ncbi:hypothetical protein AYO20_04664 [Fonsecaea nubica]|uniref:Uncharacterized protein n=1 Tax=Fonsecaea nubica TaxID=856822 RepID=A0A178D3S3_9EURO|nr:hypothetical protein AYO20_04664 [Fonsecaea nubica]OAL36003.1 hypothetical protein AYO20_04664 [Fonsecaea nubica]
MLSTSALHALCVLALTVAVESQSGTPSSTATATLDEPCAQVSALSSQYMAAHPTALKAISFPVPPDVAYACAQSVPLVKEDTLAVLTGLKALVQWQSTLGWLKDPPADWPFPPVDLVAGLEDLTNKVQDGTMTREIDFETQLVDLITSVRDGHLTYVPDAYSVFQYGVKDLPLYSMSTDGKQLPEIYAAADVIAQSLGGAEGWTPSPIVKINGTEVVSWLSEQAFNGTLTHQDLDALYNRLFVTIFAPGTSSGEFSAPSLSRYSGSSIAVEFKNGTQATVAIVAGSNQDFTNVVDGKSFYQAFCDPTVKAKASASSSSASPAEPTETTAPDPSSLYPLYPSAVAISDDGTLSGYFLDQEPGVAVLAIHEISEAAQASTQQTLANFLQQCRDANKTHLIIDVSQNPGGTIPVAYDIFKQLFPTIEPYLGAQMRAHDQANVLGEYYTPLVEQAEEQEAVANITDPVVLAGIFSPFDATSVLNDSGQAFASWDEYFGPVQVHGDKFTQQSQMNFSNVDYDESSGGIVVSGYANNSHVAPQPFLSENMVVFTDGFCASSCTILLHLLKYQAKVKSIVVGGRPQTGPMQAIGGVKGCQVLPLDDLVPIVQSFYESASPDEIKAANQTALKDLADQAATLSLRQFPGGTVMFNLLNAIAQYDESQTPLQFVYEAADCRLFYQAAHATNVTAMWTTVAEQAFGLNGQEKFSLCVAGSTNHPTSLSGNQTLYQGGEIANVTGYNPSEDAAQGSGSGSSSDNGSGSLRFASTGMTSLILGVGLAVLASSTDLIF